MSPSVSIAVHGASGRMGQAILRLAMQSPRWSVAAALVRPDSALAGQPLQNTFGVAAGDLEYSGTLAREANPGVLLDFSSAAAFDEALALAESRRIALVSGTTGLRADQRAAMLAASSSIPVLWSANFSLGVALLMRLARAAAHALPGWDCEILEAHHRHKKDAPSGTALALGRAVAEARGDDFDQVARREPPQGEMREASEIGFAVVRGGDIVGEHTVLFAGDGERIELVHRATDRDVFARGALEAVSWIAGRAAGFHTLGDVLGSPDA